MKELFFNTKTREEIWQDFIQNLRVTLPSQKIKTEEALLKVLSEDILFTEDIPYASRSLVDGFAVRAEDTWGATETNPVNLKIITSLKVDQYPYLVIKPMQAVEIQTGGFLPEMANAVVMYEHSTKINSDLLVKKAASVGENVLIQAEDVKKGDVLATKGQRLSPAHIGVLLASGITEVPVYKTPRIAIIATGDEIVEPAPIIEKGKIRDTNSYIVQSLIRKEGFEAERVGIVKDDKTLLVDVLKNVIEKFDVIIIIAGSSKGKEDLTCSAIDKIGKPGVLIHGVQIVPGKATNFGMIGEKVIIGLPGHPSSSFTTTILFVLPIIKKIAGMKEVFPQPIAGFTAGADIITEEGKENWIRVKRDGNVVYPLLSKSAQITPLLQTDGFVRIPVGVEGVKKAETVEFYML